MKHWMRIPCCNSVNFNLNNNVPLCVFDIGFAKNPFYFQLSIDCISIFAKKELATISSKNFSLIWIRSDTPSICEHGLSRKHMPFNPTQSRISATISSLAENMCVERSALINYCRQWYYWIPLVEYITEVESTLRADTKADRQIGF